MTHKKWISCGYVLYNTPKAPTVYQARVWPGDIPVHTTHVISIEREYLRRGEMFDRDVNILSHGTFDYCPEKERIKNIIPTTTYYHGRNYLTHEGARQRLNAYGDIENVIKLEALTRLPTRAECLRRFSAAIEFFKRELAERF
ncbi:MAG: hypothetical protein LBU87_03195 [Lactobacillales bacterium]|nr:hypothetical protein [Lactobacillales bacterium]